MLQKHPITKGVLLFLVLTSITTCWAEERGESEISIHNGDQTEKVTYVYYIPSVKAENPFPVLVCTHGLNIDGKEFMGEKWTRFADENDFAILGLGFTFIPEDWHLKRSYQYPQAWSGKALLEILKILAEKFPINPNELYLFGISAGSQFSIRFAQMMPQICKAVAAHAAGGYDDPQEYLPTHFLITVGELDNAKEVPRLDFAKIFVDACKKQSIAVQLEIIPNIAHQQTEAQNEMSRQFFQKIRLAK